MISLCLVSGVDSTLPIDPPTATWMPAFLAGSVASRTFCASRSVMNPDSTVSSTGINPVCPSSDRSPAFAASFVTGFVTLYTSRDASIALYEAVIAALFAGSVSFP